MYGNVLFKNGTECPLLRENAPDELARDFLFSSIVLKFKLARLALSELSTRARSYNLCVIYDVLNAICIV